MPVIGAERCRRSARLPAFPGAMRVVVWAAVTAGLVAAARSVSVEVRVGAGVAQGVRLSRETVEKSKKLARHLGYLGGSEAAGEWVPPSPPSAETLHLEGKESIPAPQFTAEELEEFLADTREVQSPKRQRHRRLLQEEEDSATGLKPQKVPHNWFGSGHYLAPRFAIATGKEECDVCYAMIDDADSTVSGVTLDPVLAGAEGSTASPQGPQVMGNLDLCDSMDMSYKAMCKGYADYLQQCPSFVHNICHEDVGGSERLRAPCPKYLKCYYCLRINPLYCLDEY